MIQAPSLRRVTCYAPEASPRTKRFRTWCLFISRRYPGGPWKSQLEMNDVAKLSPHHSSFRFIIPITSCQPTLYSEFCVRCRCYRQLWLCGPALVAQIIDGKGPLRSSLRQLACRGTSMKTSVSGNGDEYTLQAQPVYDRLQTCPVLGSRLVRSTLLHEIHHTL